MMLRLSILIALLVLSLGLLTEFGRLHTAQIQFDSRNALLIQTQHDAGTIRTLRTQQALIAEQEPPRQDVIARIGTCLAEAGLPPDRFVNLQNESDAALPSSSGVSTTYRRQSVAISLKHMTSSELGAFLEAWEKEQSVWTVTRITLSHTFSRGSRERGNESYFPGYDVHLIISAVYITQG